MQFIGHRPGGSVAKKLGADAALIRYLDVQTWVTLVQMGHFEPAIITFAVDWYLRFSLSYRDVEELLTERGIPVDHTTVWRWVQRYAPELNKDAGGN